MEIEFADNLKIVTDIPIRSIESFMFSWKPCCHAILKLVGYVDRNVQWNPEKTYSSHIKIYQIEEENTKIIYYGYIVEVELKNVGKTSMISLCAMSATCLLDRKSCSRSFHDVSKTYGEVVRETVLAEGGQVIRNQVSDKKIESPVIQNEETAWQYANRMADRIGNYIIPDVETGNPNLWFGMRNGKEVPTLQESEYLVQIQFIGKNVGRSFKVKGRDFYKIGDRMVYLGQKVTIVEVEGQFKYGELTFTYILENLTTRLPNFLEDNHSAGQGFWGVIKAVSPESVKIALDIDQGQETGDFFYPWYPETGNALYSMPEVGAKALLYFFSDGEQDGAVIHCLNREIADDARSYKDRTLNLADGNSIKLSKESLSFVTGGSHVLSIDNNVISTKASKELKIRAKGKIRLKAEQIIIKTPQELNINQY